MFKKCIKENSLMELIETYVDKYYISLDVKNGIIYRVFIGTKRENKESENIKNEKR